MAGAVPPEALDVALAAADAARAAIMARYLGGFSVATKEDLSPVTEADREAEEAIRRVISDAFPTHNVNGEELGAFSGSSELTWLIDPIDGTRSFTHRVPLFATLIALCRSDEPLLAVVDLPALGRRLHAVKGEGSWEGSRRLTVATDFDPASSLVCLGDRAQFAATGRLALYDRLQADLGLARTYTDAYGHCLVALGSAALMADPDLLPWDYSAPSLLVREAGGEVLNREDRGRAGGRFVVSGGKAAVRWVSDRV